MRVPALVAVSLLALVAGCSATLRDGVYGCAMNGPCPSGFYCWRDEICHNRVEVESDSGPGPADSGPLRDTGMITMPDTGGPVTCSPTMPGSCTGSQVCAVGAWTGPMPSYRCAVTTDLQNTHHEMACVMGSAFCVSPDACIPSSGLSRCMRPCGPPGDACAFMEDCTITTGGAHVCAPGCGAGGVCPHPGTSCTMGHCLPTGW